ncbi:TPA: WYL domain-containing protein [Yersinia enterocolitica]|uniref:DeoR family transcriptional regulator n=1 Tax=Yersinia enterocolitica TaxID=630 RepID=UPI0005E2CC42|nr:WYL domain-containing protein [Yersinia enterocolitica]CQD48623.1 transcriptional regulator [Yersinia enterocolitica]HDL6676033.1 DeoR family transcriptional regulator [Yersinia enterocolitica]HDL8233072.1 DeoR family transcriptional regulator [Yersinia enterocolitica]HDL8253835.1 DeoR family transcriptional regulator [Yersinia enterocolitica]HDM8343766.1 DeoR family transcriptional regulator [Yersinia enterocolitica]
MTQAERRHDRLAVRLSLIIGRLLAGETLNVTKLAVEFGVSVRTLRRDFRERLIYLDLEYRQGFCRLRTVGNGAQGELDVLTFAHRTGLADAFPGFDRRLVGALLASEDAPCFVWQLPHGMSSSGSLVFYRLVSAITSRQRVTLLVEGQRCGSLAPYRLISLAGSWYLAGEVRGHIKVHPLTDIHAVTVLNTTFTPRKTISQLTSQPDFIRALPHFSVIREALLLTSPDRGSTDSVA